MGAGVEPDFDSGEASLEFLKRPGTAAGKARFLPDFVEAAWVAGIASLQVYRPDAEPARDPDVNGVVFSQRASRDGGRRLD